MYRLENPVRDYAWGSRIHIPRMLGVDSGDSRWAEMWMGAHPAAPSRLEDGRTLLEAIQADPAGMLGDAVNQAFQGRLPFLMKLLAAAEPLSLQVHPTSERARIRFAEQNAAGIPIDAPERSYPDASHKPELIYALTRFEGMAGFRDLAKTAEILRELRLPWLNAIADQIQTTATPFQTLRQVVTELLGMHGPQLEYRLRHLGAAATAAEMRLHATQAGRRKGSVPDPSAVERESVRVFAAVAQLIERYPSDPGVLVTLFLNHVVLAAGEAMFIDAGVIHAYTSGFGVEIMAASDNVLRAGLTPKHVDVPELLDVANFTPVPPPLWASHQINGAGRMTSLLAPPVAEFELVVADGLREPLILANSPQVILCLEGTTEVSAGDTTEKLARGQSIYLRGDEGPVTVSGCARVAIGRTPIR